MKNTLSFVACLGGALFLLTGVTFGQQSLGARNAKVEIDEVAAQMLKTPEYSAQTSDSKKTPKRREWLEVELGFETASDSPIGIIDSLLVKYYIAIKGEAGNYILEESVTYENIPDKEEIYASVYVSPWSLARIGGGLDEVKESDVVSVGCQILFNGQVVAEGGAKLWEAANAQVQRPQGMILPKEKTPFAYLWTDRHVSAKLDR